MNGSAPQPFAGGLPARGNQFDLATDDEGEPEQHLTFGLAGETFAVAVRQVREVLDLQRIARIANAA
jgi:chemotaxis signal transduction protein